MKLVQITVKVYEAGAPHETAPWDSDFYGEGLVIIPELPDYSVISEAAVLMAYVDYANKMKEQVGEGNDD